MNHIHQKMKVHVRSRKKDLNNVYLTLTFDSNIIALIWNLRPKNIVYVINAAVDITVWTS